MAECSYARCLQERRLIKRELMKWSKNMVFIVGLERVAEELMGRRKWKLYQEVLARSQLNANTVSSIQNNSASQNKKFDPVQQLQQPEKENLSLDQLNISDQSYTKGKEIITIKKEIEENSEEENRYQSSKRENSKNETTENFTLGNSKITTDTATAINITSEKLSNKNITNKTTSRPTTPIDWNPEEKCYFCVDGKLLTVNEKGELVAESGPAQSEAELANKNSIDSDSDSSDSSPDLELHSQTNPIAFAAAAANVHKTLTSRLRDSLPSNMTSFESMGAQMAAVASIQGLQPGLGSFYPGIWYQQLAHQLMSATTTTSSETPVAESSPSIKDSPSPNDVTGEQPLDLSAKPSPNSSASGDSKQTFRSKPRMTPISGRRAYTEEELNCALQDIITGKLGTRRAAVQYGIPRSTLRNKVYKIAMEQKRETSALNQSSVLDELVDPDDEDKDLSGDDEKDDKLLTSSLLAQSTTNNLTRLTTSQYATASVTGAAAATSQKPNKSCDSSPSLAAAADNKPSTSSLDTHQVSSKFPLNNSPPTQHQSQPQTPPTIAPNPWLDPNILLQTFLLAGGLNIPGLMQPKIEDSTAIRELFANLLIHQEQLKNTASASDMLNNSKSGAALDPRILLQSLTGLHQQQQQAQHHQQQQQSQHSSAPSSHHVYQSRLPKSETPETASSVDISETSDDPSVILKIPSYKPVAGSSSTAKNGESLSSPISQITSPILSGSPQQPNNVPGISPPSLRQSSESQSPPILSLRDVIANSISRTFSQQANKDSQNLLKSTSDHNDQYKQRASISVIKNIGGTDITRFAAAPNILANNGSNSSQMGANNSSMAGGKGTRPKRGKYRNYDRDSLVEAVKAVQRGEMSVHRAGSYYGVPHSTLEYKVKERHLMRPRKREPKPQPLDDRSGNSASNNSINTKNSNIPGVVTSLDKLKASTVMAGQKSTTLMKNNPPFPSTSPNGMKVPIFDPAMAAQFQYAPHLFWPHSTGFGTLPIDFQRSSGSSGAPTTFPTNPETFLASQMMQRFHEESGRLSGNNLSTTAPTTTSNSSLPSSITNNSTKSTNSIDSTIKNARQIAESLYDTTGSNGSFLDGIIRQTLDRKTSDIPHTSHGALLDQLVKNTRPPSVVGGCGSSGGGSSSSSNLEQQLTNTKSKRPGSPLHYSSEIEIKRERSSPPTVILSGDNDQDLIEHDISSKEPTKSSTIENLTKYHESLGLKIDETNKQHQLHLQQQLQQHHHSTTATLQLLQQQQQLSSNTRHLPIEDHNGSGSGSLLHDKLGQIKTESEDSL